MIGRQDNLEHDARIVGAGADFVIVEARTQCVEVQLMIDHVVQSELEGAALDLLGQHHGQQARAAVNGFERGMVLSGKRDVCSTLDAQAAMSGSTLSGGSCTAST